VEINKKMKRPRSIYIQHTFSVIFGAVCGVVCSMRESKSGSFCVCVCAVCVWTISCGSQRLIVLFHASHREKKDRVCRAAGKLYPFLPSHTHRKCTSSWMYKEHTQQL
jgi:hypothetical protein